MFNKIKKINFRPNPFQYYTADELWTNEHTSKKMLEYHLNESIDVSSRNKAFIERSLEWIISYFNIGENMSIADFGCGPGLYTTGFAQKSAKVTGIDFSQNSIDYARKIAEKNDLKINYINANYLDFETTEKFDLITMIMCDFCALSPEQREKILLKFNALLKPNAFVLLDVFSMASFNQKFETATYERNQLNGFWSPEEYYCFVNSFKYENENVSLDKYTIIEKSRTRIVYNWLQYFSQDSLGKEFAHSGFNVTNFFANVAGDTFEPDTLEFAVVATKK